MIQEGQVAGNGLGKWGKQLEICPTQFSEFRSLMTCADSLLNGLGSHLGNFKKLVGGGNWDAKLGKYSNTM